MEAPIFVVRILLSLLLYIFLGTLLVLLWRDLKAATRPPALTAMRERPARLRVTCGNDGLPEDELFPLSAFTTIGRAEASTISIAEPYASAEHAIIAWRGGQWWLEDRDSRNGTRLNDIPVEEPLIISRGDVIGIGGIRLKFEYIDEQ